MSLQEPSHFRCAQRALLFQLIQEGKDPFLHCSVDCVVVHVFDSRFLPACTFYMLAADPKVFDDTCLTDVVIETVVKSGDAIAACVAAIYEIDFFV